MKILSTSTILELPETLEGGSAKIFCEKPYKIKRLESNNGNIIWYGYNTNWEKINDVWYESVNTYFVECDTPEYEKKYLELNIKKYRKIKLEKINDLK